MWLPFLPIFVSITSMREIVLDTETTGFDPEQGDRIVEIGAVELFNHLPTGKTYHQYINPERSMPQGAFEVHGLGDDFLRDKPVFKSIGRAFVDFIGDSKLVIHNAAFDMKFLNAELTRMGLTAIPWARAIDTLAISRARFPGSPASLDALCRRFGVDNSRREKHGALLDSEILAEVYLELVGGRQPDFGLSSNAASSSAKTTTDTQEQGGTRPLGPRPNPLPPRLTESETAAHQKFVAKLGANALWFRRGMAQDGQN
jgi:DNA polymerase-3 subunit epsilon